MKHYIKFKNFLRAYILLAGLIPANSLSAQSLLDNTQVRFFSDAGFVAIRDTANKLAPAFQFGGIEILLTSQVTDKISLLAEPVLRPDGTISMERMMIKYSFSNYLNISAGRLYTPIGLWNTTFFRYAKALTPTIDAPQIIANTEEGGSAINKDNGIQISGDDISKLRLGYRVMVGNGYNSSNSRKKVLLGNVFIEPLNNLRVSLSGMHQKMAGGMQGMNMTLNVLLYSVMYMGTKNFEFAAEYHHLVGTGAPAGSDIPKIYNIYAGYKINKVTPYVQYYSGGINNPNVMGFFDYTNATLGIRYNFSALSVLKAEAQFLKADDFAKVNQIKLLWAIGF